MEVGEQEQPQQQPTRQVPPPGAKLKRGFIRLRREENCIQWGFRIIGGSDFGEPLQILKVTQQSLAAKKGMRPGDIILKVCGTVTKDLTNEMAKMEILRAGNELDLVIERDMNKVLPKPQPKPKQRPRPTQAHDLPPIQNVNPNLQSRSFKILQETLDRMGSMSPVDSSQDGNQIVTGSPQVHQSPADEEYEEYVPPEVYIPPEERNSTENMPIHSDEMVTEPRG